MPVSVPSKRKLLYSKMLNKLKTEVYRFFKEPKRNYNVLLIILVIVMGTILLLRPDAPKAIILSVACFIFYVMTMIFACVARDKNSLWVHMFTSFAFSIFLTVTYYVDAFRDSSWELKIYCSNDTLDFIAFCFALNSITSVVGIVGKLSKKFVFYIEKKYEKGSAEMSSLIQKFIKANEVEYKISSKLETLRKKIEDTREKFKITCDFQEFNYIFTLFALFLVPFALFSGTPYVRESIHMRRVIILLGVGPMLYFLLLHFIALVMFWSRRFKFFIKTREIKKSPLLQKIEEKNSLKIKQDEDNKKIQQLQQNINVKEDQIKKIMDDIINMD